ALSRSRQVIRHVGLVGAARIGVRQVIKLAPVRLAELLDLGRHRGFRRQRPVAREHALLEEAVRIDVGRKLAIAVEIALRRAPVEWPASASTMPRLASRRSSRRIGRVSITTAPLANCWPPME